MKHIKFTFIVMIFSLIISSCGSSEGKYKGAEFENEELKDVIIKYFDNFDNIYEFQKYTTYEFIEKVYSWCSGDYSNEKTKEEMMQIYAEINKESLKLSDFYVDDISFEGDNEVILSVTRKWEDGSQDATQYSIIRTEDKWKFNDRY